MNEYGIAADWLEGRGLCPEAVRALRTDGRLAGLVVELLESIEWSARGPGGAYCPRCDTMATDHADDCGLAFLLAIAKNAKGGVPVFLLIHGDGDYGNEESVRGVYATRASADAERVENEHVEEWPCE